MKIEEGLDYYYNEEGMMVLTAHYLKNRGYCCGNGCKNCPFDYIQVPEPKKSLLLKEREQQDSSET